MLWSEEATKSFPLHSYKQMLTFKMNGLTVKTKTKKILKRNHYEITAITKRYQKMYAIKCLIFLTSFMEIVKSLKDKVLSTRNKQNWKKNPKKSKKQKKSFTFNFHSNSKIFFLWNCSCKSNLKYLIQLDNKFWQWFRVKELY